MYLIDNATAANSLPAPSALGTPGYFTSGNPGAAIPATVVDAEWLNMVMMEISNAITIAGGAALSKATRTQLSAAIQKRPAASSFNCPAQFAATGMPADTAIAVTGGLLYSCSITMLGQFNNTNGTLLAPIIDFDIKDGATVVATLSCNFQVGGIIPIGFAGLLTFHGFITNLPPPVSGSYTVHTRDAESDGGSHTYTNSSSIAVFSPCL